MGTMYLFLIPREESNLQIPQSKCGDFANSSTGEFKISNMSMNVCSIWAFYRGRTDDIFITSEALYQLS